MFCNDGVLENMFPLKAFGWPKAGALCPKAEPVCPNGELVCTRDGELDWNKFADWVPKFIPVPNDGVVPWAWVVPKIEVDVPKADVFGVPNNEGVVWVAKGLDGVVLKTDGVCAGVDAKGLVGVAKGEESVGVELAKPVELKVEVFWANGLVDDVLEENGFAAGCVNEGDEEKGFGCVLFVLNPIPPEDWPAGFGPPEAKEKTN